MCKGTESCFFILFGYREIIRYGSHRFRILCAARDPVENAAWRLYPPLSPSMSSTSPAK